MDMKVTLNFTEIYISLVSYALFYFCIKKRKY